MKIMTKEEAKKYLDIVLEQLEKETPSENLENFVDRFKDSREVLKFENNYIYVITKDNLTKLFIEKFHSRRMNDILTSLTKEKTGFKFISKEEAAKEQQEVAKLASVDSLGFDRSNRKLRAEFTFDNFVVGESNRFAFITAMKVAESPFAILNPLYIFGDVGLGKTHLMMAIGHYILDKNINANVVYTTAQQFTEDYFVYTKKDTKNIEFFYNKYRQADILLVDDIQFLENKPGTQEEFFKVFEYLHENNKQIVITSDRPANDLKLMSRLVSRFQWGMIVDIKSPDKELRINILKRKLEFLISNFTDVPADCLEIIADNFVTNIRELEGALRRFVTYCVSMNIPFTVENVYYTLEGIMPKKKDVQNQDDQKIDSLKQVVCAYFQISEQDLLSSSRKPNIVYARNLCFYITRTEFKFQLSKIGDIFGGKDHTTVTYGIEKIKEMLNSNSNTKNDIQYIKQKMDK